MGYLQDGFTSTSGIFDGPVQFPQISGYFLKFIWDGGNYWVYLYFW
jgi:hypothetical protein